MMGSPVPLNVVPGETNPVCLRTRSRPISTQINQRMKTLPPGSCTYLQRLTAYSYHLEPLLLLTTLLHAIKLTSLHLAFIPGFWVVFVGPVSFLVLLPGQAWHTGTPYIWGSAPAIVINNVASSCKRSHAFYGVY